MHNHQHGFIQLGEGLILILTALSVVVYCIAAFYTSRKKGFRKWPALKIIFWTMGVSCVLVAIVGPIAELAMINFKAHMLTHLLLGMLAPLFLVLSTPITLLLRTLPIKLGRTLSKILKSRYLQFVSHPVTAAILNMGGLWLLYTTELYQAMHQSIILHVLIHFHVFAAGYLFTSSIIYLEPVSHRYSYKYRTIVFIFFLAAHGILSKTIYANPPYGVLRSQAEEGAMLMYYGGDLIDAVLIFLLFRQWFQSTKPREAIV